MKRRNPHILEGSLAKGVMTLSAPVIFAMFFQSLLNVVDTFWLGKVGFVAVAAGSISWPIIFIIIALSSGASTGCGALVARYFGANDLSHASKVVKNSFIIGVVLSLALTFVGLISSPALFSYMGATGELKDLALEYTNIIFYGSIFFVLSFIFGAALRGEGDTKTPMKVGIAINVINMILDPIMIFGFSLGVAGAAWATIISSFMAVVIYLWFLSRDKLGAVINFNKLDFDLKIIYDVLFIGFPASLRNIANAVGVFFTAKIITVYGPAVVAAYGIGFRIESFGVLPVVAIAVSAVTMVGQNFGAKNLARAKKSGWVSAGIGVLMMSVFAVVVFFLSDWAVKIFNDDPEVVRVGSELLKIKVPAFIFSAIIMTLSSAFDAFGKSHYSFILTALRVALMVGLAYLFDSIWGFVGVWWAITISSIVLALAVSIWYYLYQPKIRIEKLKYL